MAKKFDIIVAYSIPERGIGYNGKLPWNVPQDLQRFKEITTWTEDPEKRNALIMGRKTYESIGRVLPKRYSFVLTKDENEKFEKDLYYFNSLDQALEFSAANDNIIENVFVIGGASVYAEAISHPLCRTIYATEIYPNGDKRAFDTYFPEINDHFRPNRIGKQVRDTLDNIFSFVEYKRIHNHPEKDYLKILKNLIDEGEYRQGTRNGNTYSLFGGHLAFDVATYGFPLLTTKRMFIRGIFEELMWHIRGQTNAKILANKGVHIWDAQSTKEFQRGLGLDTRYEEGDCGPIYGFQWRHYGAPYKGCQGNYNGQGRDQLMDVIHKLENYPYNRRIVINAWNPNQLNEMVLPPCHIMYQFYVRGDKFLDCHMYQRSADVFLGLPFNIASTALLAQLIANSLNKRELKVGKVIISLGDYHLYDNHVAQAKEQMKRYPFSFPTLRIKEKKNIEDYVFDDIILENYHFYPAIKAEMLP